MLLKKNSSQLIYIDFKNIPRDLLTEAQWQEKGFKLINKAAAEAVVKFIDNIHRYKSLVYLYDKQAVTTDIGACLFVINREAKKEKKAAKRESDLRNYNAAIHHGNKANKYYSLKRQVLAKASCEGIAELKCYNQKIGKTCEDSFFALYEIDNYQFHLPVKTYPKKAEIDYFIDYSHLHRHVDIDVNVAVSILQKYLDSNTTLRNDLQNAA